MTTQDAENRRVWLDVPFSQKDAAKALGARWDPQRRRWWARPHATEALQRWPAAPELPEVLPGEDRTYGGDGLYVDLIPRTCWYTHARYALGEIDWERLRRAVGERARWACEICDTPENRPKRINMDVHERWEYLHDPYIQRLRRLICVCKDCHRTTHFGLAETRGERAMAMRHLCEINNWDAPQAEIEIAKATAIWDKRSARHWKLDLSILTDAGLNPQPSPRATVRTAIAASELGKQQRRANARPDGSA